MIKKQSRATVPLTRVCIFTSQLSRYDTVWSVRGFPISFLYIWVHLSWYQNFKL